MGGGGGERGGPPHTRGVSSQDSRLYVSPNQIHAL